MNQNLRVSKTSFHMKGFALGLALKHRRNLPSLIQHCVSISSTWSELACSANQLPKSTIKPHKPLRSSWISQIMCPPCFIIIQSCYFDSRINEPFTCSRCVICVSCSVHLIWTYLFWVWLVLLDVFLQQPENLLLDDRGYCKLVSHGSELFF